MLSVPGAVRILFAEYNTRLFRRHCEDLIDLEGVDVLVEAVKRRLKVAEDLVVVVQILAFVAGGQVTNQFLELVTLSTRPRDRTDVSGFRTLDHSGSLYALSLQK